MKKPWVFSMHHYKHGFDKPKGFPAQTLGRKKVYVGTEEERERMKRPHTIMSLP